MSIISIKREPNAPFFSVLTVRIIVTSQNKFVM